MTTGGSAAAEDRDLSYALSEYVAAAHFADLDSEVIETTKLSIIDTIGVTLASTGLTPGVDAYVNTAMARGGTPESTVIGFDGQLPAASAAWLNGAFVHGLDYDDLVRDAGYHPSTPTVPSGIALAESRPGTTGKDLLLAIAIGNDVGVRLASAVDSTRAWFGTPVFGSFAGAATCAKLFGLDAQRVHNALGQAYVRCAGTLEMRWSANSGIASFNGALPNENGVLSAQLAAAGADGIENIFEGRGGLFPVYFDNAYDRSIVLDRLGEYFRGVEASFKVWPACGGSHPAIDATLQLFATVGLKADDVEELTIATTLGTLALCQPIEVRRAPTTSMDAKFSIPYSIAVAAVTGNVTLHDFLPENLGREEILQFAQKITAIDDPSLAIRKAALPARITVKTVDGQTVEHRCDQPKGIWPYSRLSADEVVSKFMVNASYARTPLATEKAEAFVDKVLRLEDLADTTNLMKELRA
jgi:2-methylcitrate dehydratase PrpD